MPFNIPTLAEGTAERQSRPNWKPEKREKKAPSRIRPTRKSKAERTQIEKVRAECVARDGDCSIMSTTPSRWMDIADPSLIMECRGESEWAHMHARRRSQTRNMAPEIRHDSAHSLMLCTKHHQDYDAHRLRITALTRKVADGPLKFARMK